MKIETFKGPQKQSQMLKLLQLGTVMVFIDSRRENVRVPEEHKDNFQLRLNFDYAFEIDDFKVLPDRLEASLSFNHKDFFCVVPFDAIYMMVNHYIQQGSLFLDSVPPEMLDVFAGMRAQPLDTTKSKDAKPKSKKKSSKKTKPVTSELKPIHKKGHLRLVK